MPSASTPPVEIEMLDILKQEYGPSDPKIAEHLNSLGLRHFHGCGDTTSALQCHKEALSILEWNKCNALLFDRVEESKAHAVEMAVTLSDIGNVMREMNDFIGAASAYKECLDFFLEGLVEEGGAIKRQIAEIENLDHDDDEFDDASFIKRLDAELEGVDREEIGATLARHPGFRSAVRGISHLLREMQYVKFVAQNAASSRRRRRMTQNAASIANLKSAIASLNFSLSDSSRSLNHEGEAEREDLSTLKRPLPSSSSVDDGSQPFTIQLQRSKSWASTHSTQEEFRRSHPLSRPRPVSRRAITSEDDYDRHLTMSFLIVPAEKSLTCALNRFPGVASILTRSHTVETPIDSIEEEDDAHLLESSDSVVDLDELAEQGLPQGADPKAAAAPPLLPELEITSPRSSAHNICSRRFAQDYLNMSITCGGGLPL